MTSQKGNIHFLLLFTAFLVVSFLIITSFAPLKQKFFGMPENTFASGEFLSIDATQTKGIFSKQLLGVALVNWEHSWGKPFPHQVPGLSVAFKEAGVGLIRYAGGLWANSVGFDRTVQKTPNTVWTQNGKTYFFNYGTDELDSLNLLADSIGSEVMIQVNIANNDPQMWADMVRYVNLEHGYNFKYWELGNELDYDTTQNITATEYASRVKLYIDAMKDVDPTIKIIAGVPASAHEAISQNYSDSVTSLSSFLTQSATIISAKGRKIDDLSYHWYQACNSNDINSMYLWSFNIPTDSWRNSYSRIWSQIAPQRVKSEIIQSNSFRQGVTELNFDACNYDNPLNGNFSNALWASDTIGRLGYNGTNFITWYEGYAGQSYSLVYPDNDTAPTKVQLRPSYYALYMYNKYFGNQYLTTNSFDESKLSIFASTDTNDPGKLKLRITNLTNTQITTPINLTGFNTSGGEAYTLSSTNPTDISPSSMTQNSSVKLNGVSLDGANLIQSGSLIQPQTVLANGNSFSYTFPAYSTVAIILNQSLLPSPSPSPSLAGDVDGNGKVNIFDYNAILSDFGKTGTNLASDLNKNGRVDIFDYNIVLSNFGKKTP